MALHVHDLVDDLYLTFFPGILVLVVGYPEVVPIPDPRVRDLSYVDPDKLVAVLTKLRDISTLHNLMLVAWCTQTTPEVESIPDFVVKSTEDGFEILRIRKEG